MRIAIVVSGRVENVIIGADLECYAAAPGENLVVCDDEPNVSPGWCWSLETGFVPGTEEE
ncbi:MAG: hypothetical protein ABS99_00815 [Acetobacteraceae bacterium SCN 69-10]|nr:MAG: hypothetical protein ABS99_00815 [Acetobacteraceae bacterium SCN 69-10]